MLLYYSVLFFMNKTIILKYLFSYYHSKTNKP